MVIAAIALLCQFPGSPYPVHSVRKEEEACQKYYVACINKKHNDMSVVTAYQETPLGECIMEKQ